MKLNQFKVIIVCASILLSYAYGVITVQYKVFPFDQLQWIIEIIGPKQQQKQYSDYYYSKKYFFEQHGRHDYDVVFIGDSITDRAEWEDLFPSLKIANRGIEGDTTDGILKRLDSIYSTSANRAFIMIGINDFNAGRSVDEVFENYKAIVNQLYKHKMTVYIQSTLFVGKQFERLNAKVAEINARLRLLAKQNDSMTYIDLNAGLMNDSLLNPVYSRDGLHLNGQGYTVWKNIISSYVQ